MKYEAWTKNEIEILTPLMEQGKTAKNIKPFLPRRTFQQIGDKMRRISGGLSKTDIPWTQTEETILMSLLKQSYTVSQIQREIPNRKRGVIFSKVCSKAFNFKENLYRQWTNQEEQELLEMSKKESSHIKMAKLLNRPRQSITGKLFEMSLRKNKVWTEKEDEKLKILMAQKIKVSKIAFIMKIKQRIIRYRIAKLGLEETFQEKYKENIRLAEKCQHETLYKNLIRKFSSSKLRAEREGLNFNLTKDHLFEIYKQQEGNCYYTGAKMLLSGRQKEKNLMSLDKKVPRLGYTIGNVVFCCDYVNSAKSNLTDKEFTNIIKSVYESESRHYPIEYQI